MIGYASKTIGVLGTEQKTCTLKYATEEKLLTIIETNLNALDLTIEYNYQNDILLYRISSDIIPFGSSPANQIDWGKVFADKFADIGKKIKQYRMRVSMHPGQYTVLNSFNEDVVEKAILDLKYHAHFLDCLNTDTTSKLILHVGGVYGDKISAIKRFIENFQRLPENVKKRLIIENDDVSYNIEDVLYIAKEIGIPVVFDNLHHEINPPTTNICQEDWIDEVSKTWQVKDGKQKIHYSQQAEGKNIGSHSQTIAVETFKVFHNQLKDKDIDIMLEVKDKNLSALKCIHVVNDVNIKKLEEAWSKYKYTVLERSNNVYQAIRELLKEKKRNNALAFYKLIEASLNLPQDIGSAVNALEHVWGYFSKNATEKEKKHFFNRLSLYKQNKASLSSIKSTLLKLAIQYDNPYLCASYYFHI